MRRSFGPMGGGGGGGMMKTIHRAVRAGSGSRGSNQQPFSQFTNYNSSRNNSPPTYKPSSSDHSTNNSNNSNILSLSSSHHHGNHPNNEYDDYVFATVPSSDEVHHALSSLQQVIDPPTSYQEDPRWELDWIEPSRSMMHSQGPQSVYEAFRLLQSESSVKRMVVSLSSDKSVWEAVMNNEAVRELRDSVYEANKSISGRSGTDETSNGSIPVSDILDWIFFYTKEKVMEILEKATKMVNKLFESPRNEKIAQGDGQEAAAIEPFEKKLGSSFMLTVMVLLIVVVSRISRS